MDEVIAKLEPKDYWEWRTTIAEMQLAQLLAEKEAHKLDSMVKDVEIQRLRLSLYKVGVDHTRTLAAQGKAEYEKFKSSLETKLGVSLSNTVIDDVTYEVKKIES